MITLIAFLRQRRNPPKWYDEIAALPGFLKHFRLHLLRLKRGVNGYYKPASGNTYLLPRKMLIGKCFVWVAQELEQPKLN
jgi:hypothetical protein